MWARLIVAVLVVGFVCGQKRDFFTAIVDLEKLLVAEKGIADDLRAYIEQQTLKLERLRKIADDMEKHSVESLSDPERHVGNPINAYLLIKRFTLDWNSFVEKEIRGTGPEEFLNSLSSRTCYFPDENDLKGAAFALLRLQDVYALKPEKLVEGDILGVKDSPPLTAADCYFFGTVAYNAGDYYHTIIWMEQALKLVNAEQTPSVSRALVLDYLSYSLYMQGNLYHALNLTNEWLLIEPDNVRALSNKNYYEQMIAEEQQKFRVLRTPTEPYKNERPLDEYRRSEMYSNYERLCRGERVMDYPLKHKLTCRYARHHPSLYISPIKEEMVHLDPPIRVFYNVLTQKQMDKVKELGYPLLSRSVVYHKSNSASISYQDYRISKSAWLSDSEDPLIGTISLKARVLSNLTLDTAEQLQVLNYGIGGHYETHCDFATKRELSTFEQQQGNRVATFICYMTDVKVGGSTVFPDIGLQLVAKKSNCALWYNLRRSGEGDFETRHAACPVLLGYKWACNKWFHERGQEFIRPCSLNPTE